MTMEVVKQTQTRGRRTSGNVYLNKRAVHVAMALNDCSNKKIIHELYGEDEKRYGCRVSYKLNGEQAVTQGEAKKLASLLGTSVEWLTSEPKIEL